MRLAAAADVHCRDDSLPQIRALLERLVAAGDVVCLCGDLTDHGTPSEARVIARAMEGLRDEPILAVLGNHDHQGGEPEEIRRILIDAGIVVLAGDCHVVDGIGFAGTKGFGGGFDRHALEPWGERAIKEFAGEAVREALLLEQALARLETPTKIALLHYSPIAATVEGEPLPIHPFLGSSRLEEPINRFRCAAALHGHAHHGALSGHTSRGVPVFNVSLPVLRNQVDPDAFVYVCVEAETDERTGT